MRTILIIVMSLLCLGAHAGDNSKKKPSKNLTCCKVYLKDGTVHEGYLDIWFDNSIDIVRINDYNAKMFSKSKKWNESLVDSVVTWPEAYPQFTLRWVPIKAKMFYIGQPHEVLTPYRIFMLQIFEGRNVSAYIVNNRVFGKRVVYYAPGMTEGHAIFKFDGTLTEKRRKTLKEEFKDYPIMTDFIDRMQKDDLKKNPMAFFIRLDEAMGEGKAINNSACAAKKSLASFPYKNLKHSSDTPHHGQFFHEATVMPSRLHVIAGLHPHERFGIYVEGCLQ